MEDQQSACNHVVDSAGNVVEVPPGFVQLDLSKPLPSGFDSRKAFTWLGSWKPCLNGIGVREVIVPDPNLDYDPEHYELVPCVSGPETEVLVHCENEAIDRKFWMNIRRLTSFGVFNPTSAPLRIPKQYGEKQ